MYDRCMKRFLPALLLLLIIITPFSHVFATSQQAYQDYLYQFDVYRNINTNFQVAKNEYQKFQSLSAQSDALGKAKILLSQRDTLLRSYLLLLNEKLMEDQGLSPSTKQLYQALLANEVTFLNSHAQLIPSAGSIDDVTQVSNQLSSHYMVLQTTIRQIMIGLSLGQLSILSHYYDQAVKDAQILVANYSGVFTPQKQETMNRWVLQITNKRAFYQQKYDALVQKNAALVAQDEQDLDTQYNAAIQEIAEARQYLKEGASFLIELKNSLKFMN
jgi:hypothetical protein